MKSPKIYYIQRGGKWHTVELVRLIGGIAAYKSELWDDVCTINPEELYDTKPAVVIDDSVFVNAELKGLEISGHGNLTIKDVLHLAFDNKNFPKKTKVFSVGGRTLTFEEWQHWIQHRTNLPQDIFMSEKMREVKKESESTNQNFEQPIKSSTFKNILKSILKYLA